MKNIKSKSNEGLTWKNLWRTITARKMSCSSNFYIDINLFYFQ